MTAKTKLQWSTNDKGILFSSDGRWRIVASESHRGWWWLEDEHEHDSRPFAAIKDAKDYAEKES